MIKFAEVPFTEFQELVNFLKFNDDEHEYHNITKRLGRFIEGLDAFQSILIDNMVEDILTDKLKEAEILYNSFHENYPDKMFDENGTLDMSDIKYFEIALQSCDMLFEQAEEKRKNNTDTQIDRQIYNAKTLSVLKELKGEFNYPMRRVLYFKKNNISIAKETLYELEGKIREICPEKFNDIMGRFLFYIYDKKYDKCSFFIDHFLHRVSILHKDINHEYKSNEEFYRNLTTLGE